MIASVLTAGLPGWRPRRMPAGCLPGLLGLVIFAGPAVGGVVFREVERVESIAAPESWQQRQVFADGANCKILIEQSSDPLEPAGSYFLTLPDGSYFIDPARATLAPVVPADMHPTERVEDDGVSGRTSAAVALEHEVEEPGPRMFDLPTTHHVYRLRIEGANGPASHVEERHELWLAPLPDGPSGLQAWRERRINEDAGTGAARAAVREAVARMYGEGLPLRHIIERREPATTAATQGMPPERIARAITQIDRQAIPADIFRKPTGLADTEFLAPSRE